MTPADILRTSVFALRGNWMRSTLTSLGVIIGIAAVIIMVSVGQGTQAEIDKLVSGLGSNRLDVGAAGSFGGGGARVAQGSRYTLTQGDAEAMREQIPELQYVAGSVRRSHASRVTAARGVGSIPASRAHRSAPSALRSRAASRSAAASDQGCTGRSTAPAPSK